MSLDRRQVLQSFGLGSLGLVLPFSQKTQASQVKPENPENNSKQIHQAQLEPRAIDNEKELSLFMKLLQDPTVNEVMFSCALATAEITRLIEVEYENHRLGKPPYDGADADKKLIWNNANLAALLATTSVLLGISIGLKPLINEWCESGNQNSEEAKKSATMWGFHAQTLPIAFLHSGLTEYFRDHVLLPQMQVAGVDALKAHPYKYLMNPAQTLAGLKTFTEKKLSADIEKAKDTNDYKALLKAKTALELTVTALSHLAAIKIPGDRTDIARFTAMAARQSFRTRMFMASTPEKDMLKQLPVQTGLTITWPVWYAIFTGLNLGANSIVDFSKPELKKHKEWSMMGLASAVFFLAKTPLQRATMKQVQNSLIEKGFMSESSDEFKSSVSRSIQSGDYSIISRFFAKPAVRFMETFDSKSLEDGFGIVFKPVMMPAAIWTLPDEYKEQLDKSKA